MVWKLIIVDNAGNEMSYGGDDIKKINKYFSGWDLILDDPTDEVNIQTDTKFGNEKFSLLAPNTGFRYIFRTQDITADRIVTMPLMEDDAEIQLSAAGSVTDWGDFMQTFRHQKIAFRNPTNTFSYIWNTNAIDADRNLLLPVLTSDDTLVFANASQTLTNKTLTSPTITAMTIDTDSNTIKHSTTNDSGDLLVNTGSKFDRKARGAANQVFVMNSTGTNTAWIDPSSLDITGGSITGFPTVDNTVAGVWYGTSAIGASGIWNGFLTNTSTVTPTNIVDTSGRMGLRYTLAALDAVAGFRTNDEYFTLQNDPELWVRYKYLGNSQDAEYRVNIGFINDVTRAFDAGENLLANYSAVMWYKDENPITENIQLCRNDGDATQDDDTGLFVEDTDEDIHTIRIFGDSTNSRFGASLDGANATYYTTEIPASTTRLGCVVQFINDDANTRFFELYGAYFKAKVL